MHRIQQRIQFFSLLPIIPITKLFTFWKLYNQKTEQILFIISKTLRDIGHPKKNCFHFTLNPFLLFCSHPTQKTSAHQHPHDLLWVPGYWCKALTQTLLPQLKSQLLNLSLKTPEPKEYFLFLFQHQIASKLCISLYIVQSRINDETLKDIGNNSTSLLCGICSSFYPRILLVFATMVIREFSYHLGHAFL